MDAHRVTVFASKIRVFRMDNTPTPTPTPQQDSGLNFWAKNFGISKNSVNFALELIRFQFLNTNLI